MKTLTRRKVSEGERDKTTARTRGNARESSKENAAVTLLFFKKNYWITNLFLGYLHRKKVE